MIIDDFKSVKKRPIKSSKVVLPVPPDPPVVVKPTNAAEEKPFQTPEQVASAQEAPVEPIKPLFEHTPEELTVPSPDTKKPGRARKLALRWPPGKKEYISAAVIILLLVLGSSAWILTHHKAKVVAAEPKKAVVVKPAVVVPTTVPSALTGLPVAPSVNNGPVTGVMIENSQDARPQSGLGQAGVVFEAIAEGGITRFLALFQDTAPDNVGPIRSARPYYIQWAMGFDAGYAHVGGSPEALADIKSWGTRDLDQFANGAFYHRITTRDAPHNVYTPIAKLNELEASKGYTSSKFTSLARTTKEAPLKVATARSVDLTLSGPFYNVHYDYNPPTNSYNRNEGGAPHIDANTNTQISPKVVIALVIPYSYKADGYHSDYSTIGSGPVYIFQDGGVTTGTWTKSSMQAQFTFADSAGKEIKLNPGQTWLTAVSSTSNVTSSP